MRLSPGLLTFLVGLLVLAIVGVVYQQSLIASGNFAPAATEADSASANVKYMCPMRCVELDEPGECPVCGMDMTAVEIASPLTFASAATYVCPMHPQVEQDRPGTCPICGMELVARANDAQDVDEATQQMVAAVKLSPLQTVLSDVQPIHPTIEHMATTVKAIGVVEIAEDMVNSLVSWQAGRVDNLVLKATGGKVTIGEHLLDIYSEELVQAQEEYLLALSAVEQLGESDYESIADSMWRLLDAARRKLLRLGMTADQLTELEVGGAVLEHVAVYASHSGIVMDKFITEGMYVREGERLFTVADLDTVWVVIEVYEADMMRLGIGSKVTLHCPVHPGMLFTGKVELIEPSLTPGTRTHRVRVVVANPDYILRPGMIMEAELTVDYGELLLLPRNAILHTGDGDLVYLLVGEHQWQPQQVTTGQDFGDMVEVTSGLAEGDTVAGTAVFLIDSEAQLKGIPRLQTEAGETTQIEKDTPHAGHNY